MPARKQKRKLRRNGSIIKLLVCFRFIETRVGTLSFAFGRKGAGFNLFFSPVFVFSLFAIDFRTDVIGQGAYGIVYKGRKEDTNETVAIKRIPFADTTPEGGVPCNVIREISLLRELDHPNVVRTYVCSFEYLRAV